MTFAQSLETFLLAAAVFAVIDLGWITLVVNKMYRSELGDIILKKPRRLPGALFYIIYIAGLVYFAVGPAREHGTVATALRDGALYGFFTYATFDLTNWSVVRAWTAKVVVADIAWGVIISGAVALLVRLIMGVS